MRVGIERHCWCRQPDLAETQVVAGITVSARAKGKRVLFCVHRRELVYQSVAKCAEAGVQSGIIASGFPMSLDQEVQVGSIQTLVRRRDTLPKFDLIVCDEAHHSISDTWSSLIESQPQAKSLASQQHH